MVGEGVSYGGIEEEKIKRTSIFLTNYKNLFYQSFHISIIQCSSQILTTL